MPRDVTHHVDGSRVCLKSAFGDRKDVNRQNFFGEPGTLGKPSPSSTLCGQLSLSQENRGQECLAPLVMYGARHFGP